VSIAAAPPIDSVELPAAGPRRDARSPGTWRAVEPVDAADHIMLWILWKRKRASIRRTSRTGGATWREPAHGALDTAEPQPR
jgi:hypothetical protein